MHSAVFVASKLPGYIKPYTYNILESCGHGFAVVHEEREEKYHFAVQHRDCKQHILPTLG
jgi:hypothetical protein